MTACMALLTLGAQVYPCAAQPLGREQWRAYWVWGAEVPHGPNGFLRRTVEVRPGLEHAWLQMSGDDGWELFVNGQRVAGGGFWWRTTTVLDLAEQLHPGPNLLCARIRNAAHPGGLLIQAALVYQDGTSDEVVTDRTWRFASTEQDGWLGPDFDDSQWEPATETGRPPVGPWGELPIEYKGPAPRVTVTRLEGPPAAQAGEDLVVQLAVRPEEPVGRDVLAYARLLQKGELVAGAEAAPEPATSQWTVGREYVLPALRVRVPRAMYSAACELEAGLYRVALEGQPHTMAVQVAGREGQHLMTPTAVREYRGAPTLFVGGQPTFALWFFQDPIREEDARAFGEAGINVFTTGVSLGWNGPDQYDYTGLDRMMARLLEWNPNALLVPRVWMGAPGWWVEAHEDEVTTYATGVEWGPNVWGGTKQASFASLLWRQEAGEALRRLVRHINDSPYSDRVISYHLAGGIYGEWHYWSAPDVPDTSAPMQRAFAAYLRGKYGADREATIPTLEERRTGDLGMFRDPQRQQRVVDYYEGFHNATVDSIEGFCRIVKEETQGQLTTGVFHGYLPDLGWAQEGDHRAFPRAVASPYIDWFSSPHSYARRALGEDGLFRNFPAAVRLHGKLFIDEGDDRTHLANDPAFTSVRTEEESLQVLWREFANAVTHDVGLWYMDQQGHWFHTPRLMAELKRMREWGERSLQLERRRVSEIAVLCNLPSEFRITDAASGLNHLSAPLYVQQFGELCKLGAPFDTHLIEDLAAAGMPEYKLYVVLDSYALTGEERRLIRERLQRAGKTVLWFYAPGFVTDEALSVEAMSDLIGMRMQLIEAGGTLAITTTDGLTFGPGAQQVPLFACADPAAEVLGRLGGTDLAGFVRKGLAGWTSVYCTAPGIPSGVLRELAREAGVHIYSQSDDPLSANNNWLSIHTATAGPKRFLLREERPVYEVVEDRPISPGCTSFEVELPEHVTRLYYIGPMPQ